MDSLVKNNTFGAVYFLQCLFQEFDLKIKKY